MKDLGAQEKEELYAATLLIVKKARSNAAHEEFKAEQLYEALCLSKSTAAPSAPNARTTTDEEITYMLEAKIDEEYIQQSGV